MSHNNCETPKTQSDLADQLGISVNTLLNYKTLADMIPELDELVTTGIVTKTTALAIMKQMDEKEQVELVSNLDTTKKITQREVQTCIDKLQAESLNRTKLEELKEKLEQANKENESLRILVKENSELASMYRDGAMKQLDFEEKMKKMKLEKKMNTTTTKPGWKLKN